MAASISQLLAECYPPERRGFKPFFFGRIKIPFHSLNLQSNSMDSLKMNTKGKFFYNFFIISSFFARSKLRKIIGLPIRIAYKIIIQWIIGIDISDITKIGRNLNVYHGQGLIVSSDTIIGDNVILRHNTTIGIAKEGGRSPVISDNVDVGSNSVIIGGVTIGKNCIVGAGSVVIKDVPDDAIVAGNPAKIISYRKN